MSVRTNGEIALAPAVDLIQLGGIGHRPRIAMPPRPRGTTRRTHADIIREKGRQASFFTPLPGIVKSEAGISTLNSIVSTMRSATTTPAAVVRLENGIFSPPTSRESLSGGSLGRAA